jgi:general secretion pathway protein D
VVRDQQTVVIGGLMRDEITTGQTKVPVLGDIPLIGALFRSSQKQKIKKNLLLFLTPYIIRSPADLRAIYERKMRERQEFLDRYFVFGDSDYEPPMDYSRTRGLIGEMLVELGLLDDKRKLLADAASKTEMGHAAKAAVGQAPEVSREEGDVTIEPEGGEAPQPEVQQAEPMPAPEAPPPPPVVVE